RQHSQTQAHQRARLDPNQRSPHASRFEEELLARVVGQQEAVRALGSLYEIALAGMAPPKRPIGTLLFLGPTGAGKTRVAEAAAEVLFGDPGALIKIDCAEYQHGHEISKLIGSPPGYVGYADSSPLLRQEHLDRFQSRGRKLAILLVDEIEKASPVLWQLLLGVLDRATLTLGDNRRVDFSRTIIVLTSNLGAQEMAEMVSGGIGFAPAAPSSPEDASRHDERLRRTAIEAARRSFSPEFMNRIDRTVVFHSLGEPDLRRILDLELEGVQRRILTGETRFRFACTDAVKELLLEEGTDRRYGARHLRRAIERLLVSPLARLVATGQVRSGDVVEVEREPAGDELVFRKRPAATPAVAARRAHAGDARRAAASVVVATTVAVTAAVGVTTGLARRRP
ncbi:MAG TPA: AAA family ATPase, partial [Gemmatimonadaceae bacterium]